VGLGRGCIERMVLGRGFVYELGVHERLEFGGIRAGWEQLFYWSFYAGCSDFDIAQMQG